MCRALQLLTTQITDRIERGNLSIYFRGAEKGASAFFALRRRNKDGWVFLIANVSSPTNTQLNRQAINSAVNYDVVEIIKVGVLLKML